jgi:serine/threonine-protein kinase
MDLAVGLELSHGRYRLTELLGEGGMASVWAAEQRLEDGRTEEVVLKILLPEFRRVDSKREMFLAEARLAQDLHHPNIVAIYDVDQFRDMDFLVMERIWGKDLESLICRAKDHQQPIPWDIAIQLVIPVAEALQYANSRHDAQGRALTLVHRDIKPANLLFHCTGDVKIIDFGVAKASNSDLHTQTGLVKGTIAYMSPEQLRAEPLDIRSDLFSLTVVLYELLTTRRPFWGDTFTSLMLGILTREPPRLASMRGDLPPALVHFVHRCLDKNIAQRPTDGTAFAQELREILQASPHRSSLGPYFAECFPEFMKAWQHRQLYAETSVVDTRALLPSDTRGDSSERFTGSHYRPVGVGASNPASVETLLETPGVELASASLALDDHEDHTPTYDSELSSVSDSSKSFLFAGVGIVLLLAAVGGFFWWKQRSASDDNNSIVVVVPSRRAVSRQRSRRPQVTSRRPMPSPPVARRASLTPRRKALVARPARLPSPALRRKAPQRVAVAPIAQIRRPRRRARTRTGSVQVVMTPRCQLYKGQRSLGWTPRVVTQLRPGRHVLRCVNKKKFFNHSFAVEIKAGRRIVVRKEVRKGSFVAFANHWGKIVVKGFGKIGTTQQIKSLYAGRYTLLVFHGNKQRYKIIKLVIRPGKRQKIKVKW